MSSSAIAMPRERKKEDYERLLSASLSEYARPSWAGLVADDKMSSVSCRLAEETVSEIRDIESRVPGLTDSAALRLLAVIGLEVLRCVDVYAPGVWRDAIRDGDAVPLNVMRFAAFACPLVVSGFDAVLGGESDVR